MMGLACLGMGHAAEPTPLINAHSHNDYEHTRPLLDALEQGFCSFEADIWLVDGQLLVAHDRQAVNTTRTLERLYLDPLRARIQKNQGRVYPGGPPCLLLIDVKSDAEATYAVLKELLQNYADLLTRFTPTNTTTNALTVVLSGNRATGTLTKEPLRFAAIDGRLPDLETNPSPHLIPLISDNWRNHFQWRGTGPLSPAEQLKLKTLVARAHTQSRRIRFWSAPDMPAAWAELQAAGVDLINTDHLAELREFLPH